MDEEKTDTERFKTSSPIRSAIHFVFSPAKTGKKRSGESADDDNGPKVHVIEQQSQHYVLRKSATGYLDGPLELKTPHKR